MTSSMLAVFERIDLSLLETLLAAASGESTLQMVTFTNQPPGAGHSVPDARISASFSYWFEVKTDRGALRRKQLEEHRANLGAGGDERLFAITPDAVEPAVVAEVVDERLVWFNFQALSDAVDAVLDDETNLVGERTEFLLRELQALLVEDGLLDTDEVVVVAARTAYGEYQQHGAYACQPGRVFRDGLTHMGFYYRGAIQPEVARILYREDDVLFTSEEAQRRREMGDATQKRMATVIEDLIKGITREEGLSYQVFLLSRPGDPESVMLAQPIANDTKAESGRPFAWTMGQRYVRLAKLTEPGVMVTSDLERP